MKFIKTVDGDFISIDTVKKFSVCYDNDGYFVDVTHNDNSSSVIAEFNSLSLARSWLDDFVAKLNAEELLW